MPTSDYEVTGWALQLEDLTLPSGQRCQINKNIDFIEAGILEEIDFLRTVVQDEHIDRVKGPQDHRKRKLTKAQEENQFIDLMKDAQNSEKFSKLLDKVTVYAVVQPKVELAWDENGKIEKIDGVVYTDMVNFTDKVVIFEHATGGLKNLESFSAGSDKDLGDLADEPSDVEPPV